MILFLLFCFFAVSFLWFCLFWYLYLFILSFRNIENFHWFVWLHTKRNELHFIFFFSTDGAYDHWNARFGPYHVRGLRSCVSQTAHLPNVRRYEPSDDSFLFLDALEKEYQKIKEIDPVIITEIGPGSGILSTALTKTLSTFLHDFFSFSLQIRKERSLHSE